MTHVIYGLKDPVSKLIRYVGYTGGDVNLRLSGHIKESVLLTCHRHKWIRKLFLKKLRPIVVILEVVTLETWVIRECYWIKKFGKQLTNGTEGGEGLISPSKDVRKRISQTLIQRHAEGVFVNKRRAYGPVSEQTKQRISEGVKNSATFKTAIRKRRGVPLTKEHRKKLSKALKGKKFTKEHKTKISVSLQGNTHWAGKKHKEETKLKISLAQRGTKNHRFGKKIPRKVKLKMSLSHLGVLQTQAAKDKVRLARSGSRKIVRGLQTKMLSANQPLPNGWRFARPQQTANGHGGMAVAVGKAA